mgnify:CR=1 FL=1
MKLHRNCRGASSTGAGPQAQGATRLVQHYHSRDRRSIATLLCAKGAGGTSGEVALVIDPFDSAQPAGLRSAADGLLSADDQLQRFSASGWRAEAIDGHDPQAIDAALRAV